MQRGKNCFRRGYMQNKTLFFQNFCKTSVSHVTTALDCIRLDWPVWRRWRVQYADKRSHDVQFWPRGRCLLFLHQPLKPASSHKMMSTNVIIELSYLKERKGKCRDFTCNSKAGKISLSHESNKKDEKSKTKEKKTMSN